MIHGIINVYKERGFTSHDVVAKLRGIIGQRKIGHTGTLDPDAEGVLPVCLGKATKVCELLADKDKTYETVLLLGKTTDTQDVTGTTIEEKDCSTVTEEALRKAVESFVGEYHQIPPMYSALKINGKKLYELAREGKSVERKVRTVWVHHINIQKIELPRVHMEVSCSKGTYIRTLCHDMGEVLAVGGCMERLCRTKVERFYIKESHTLSEIEKQKEKWNQWIIPVESLFLEYRTIVITKEEEALLYNGNMFPQGTYLEEPMEKERVKVCNTNGAFVAIYEYCADRKAYKIVKMFFNRQETEE